MQRMGGTLRARQRAPDGGLLAHIRLKKAPERALDRSRLAEARPDASRASSRQTARASIASPSPTGPIFSAVFALTLT